MAEAIYRAKGESLPFTPEADVAAGQVLQTRDGRAAFAPVAIAAGVLGAVTVAGRVTVPKTTGVVILSGGKVFWDYSANAAHFKAANDQDFYLGVAAEDGASADDSIDVTLNVQPVYLLDLARDPFASALAGTQAAGGFGGTHRRGGAHKLALTSTSEAQKVDALSKDGFAVGANAIVEFAVEVVAGGSGAADVSVGVANGTHATDADSIAQHLFLHLDGGATDIKFQSKDGTTTVNATDSTLDYTIGTRFEVWFDLRNPAAAAVYVNGVRVLDGTTGTATAVNVAAAGGTLKLLAHAEKTTGTDTIDVDVDWLRVRIAE